MAATTNDNLTVRARLRSDLAFFKEVEGTDSQVETGIRTYRRPNRALPRLWRPKAVARVYCDCISNGHTRTQIEAAIKEQCALPGTDCDCDEVKITLRNVLKVFVVVGAVLALLTPIRNVLPVILATVVLRLLPLAVRRFLPNILQGVKALPRMSRTIEGTAVRVREQLTAIESAQARSAALRIRVSRP